MTHIYIVNIRGGEWEDTYEILLGVFSTYDKAYEAVIKYAGGKDKLESLWSDECRKSFKAKATGCYADDEFIDIAQKPIDKRFF